MKKFLVNCKKYNNSKNVLFMMDQDDDRAGGGNYDIVEKGKSKKGIFYTDSGKKYQIHADWSLIDVTVQYDGPTA